ncbi:MAG: dTMP kinase [Planctomycetota bacterium]
MFIVFDGIDGGGKTTQLNRLVDWIESEGHSVITCKDPGSTELGEKLREMLLTEQQMPISMRAEMMLFTTARTELIQQIVKPALKAGKSVVLDRYILSTVVYQGHAGKLDPDEIRLVNQIATEGVQPDLTFILDLDTKSAMQRLGDSLDRMEARGETYFSQVRQGFLQEASASPEKIVVINADQDPDSIHHEILNVVKARSSDS